MSSHERLAVVHSRSSARSSASPFKRAAPELFLHRERVVQHVVSIVSVGFQRSGMISYMSDEGTVTPRSEASLGGSTCCFA